MFGEGDFGDPKKKSHIKVIFPGVPEGESSETFVTRKTQRHALEETSRRPSVKQLKP